MKFEAVLATGQEDTDHERFSQEALDSMVAAAPGLPVRFGAGAIERARRDRGTVKISGSLDLPTFPIGVYAVPEFAVLRSSVRDGVRIYEEVRLAGVALTRRPVDNNLTPIEEIC